MILLLPLPPTRCTLWTNFPLRKQPSSLLITAAGFQQFLTIVQMLSVLRRFEIDAWRRGTSRGVAHQLGFVLGLDHVGYLRFKLFGFLRWILLIKLQVLFCNHNRLAVKTTESGRNSQIPSFVSVLIERIVCSALPSSYSRLQHDIKRH